MADTYSESCSAIISAVFESDMNVGEATWVRREDSKAGPHNLPSGGSSYRCWCANLSSILVNGARSPAASKPFKLTFPMAVGERAGDSADTQRTLLGTWML